MKTLYLRFRTMNWDNNLGYTDTLDGYSLVISDFRRSGIALSMHQKKDADQLHGYYQRLFALPFYTCKNMFSPVIKFLWQIV